MPSDPLHVCCGKLRTYIHRHTHIHKKREREKETLTLTKRQKYRDKDRAGLDSKAALLPKFQ